MIVKCEQCQTRFKIPDEKVTDKGVKVRCTKCQHTFRVKKEAEVASSASEPPAAPVPEFDPFAKFGAPAELPPEESTRPGVFALGVEASKNADLQLFSVPNADSVGVFEAPTRIAALSAEMAQLIAAPNPPSPNPASKPFDFSAPQTQTSNAYDPFAQFAAPAPSPGLSKPPPMPGGRAPATSAPAPALSPSNGRASPAMPPPAPPRSAPSPAAFDPSPPPALTEESLPAFNFSGAPFDSAQGRPTAEEPALNFDIGAAGPVGPQSGLLSDVPAMDDFFEKTPAGSKAASSSSAKTKEVERFSPFDDESPLASHDSRAALFDMPESEPEPQAPLVVSPAPSAPSGVALGKIALRRVSAEYPRPQEEAKGPRKGLSLVLNVAIAAVTFTLVVVFGAVYLTEGKLEASSFTWEKLKTILTRRSDWVTVDLTNGLYDTRSGRAVFYVRGEVENRGVKSSRVKVRAEILDGESLVRSAEGWAGAVPTPEELHQVLSADDLQKLAAKTAQTAHEIAPGKDAPFFVGFYEYPPDLRAFRVKVVVTEVDPKQTAFR